MADTSPIRDANFWREEFLGLCELAEELRRDGQVDPDDDSEDPGDPQEEVLAADLEPGKPSSSALKKVSAVVPIHALRTTTCTIVQFLKEAVIRLHRIPTYECACCERIFHSSSRLVNHLEIYHADAMEVESDIDNSITITAIPDVEIVEKTSAIIKLIPEESVNTSVTTVVQGATDSNTQGIVTTDEEMITNISSPASLIPYRYSPTCLESETLSSPAVAEDINDLPILPCTGTGNCQLSSTTNPTDLIVQTSKEPVVENMSVLVLPKPVVPEIPVSEDLQQRTPKDAGGKNLGAWERRSREIARKGRKGKGKKKERREEKKEERKEEKREGKKRKRKKREKEGKEKERREEKGGKEEKREGRKRREKRRGKEEGRRRGKEEKGRKEEKGKEKREGGKGRGEEEEGRKEKGREKIRGKGSEGNREGSQNRAKINKCA